MHLTVKISCTLLLLGTIQFADSFPQFSIPFVSWNKNKEEPPKLAFSIQNSFSSSFGKNRQYIKSRENNEVIRNEKIIPVTPIPNGNYNKCTFVQTTQDPKIWEIYEEKKQGTKDIEKDKPTVDNRNTFRENNEKEEINYFSDDVINKIFRNYDSTTESTTEYEPTTVDESDLYRIGMPGHVVATLLG